MIIKRAGSPYYSFKFMFKGVVFSESTRQANAKVAREIESAKRTELSKGEVGIYESKKGPTLEQFCTDVFEPEVSKTVGGNIKEKTWADFYLVGIKALKSFKPIATARLDEITPELIGQFKAYRRNHGQVKDKSRPECEISTVNASLRVLRRILNYAAASHKPTKGLFFLEKAPVFDLMAGENKRDRVLTAKEETTYLESAAACSQLLSDFTTVLFDTGLRPEECHRLEWEYISWESGLHGECTLRVTHGKTANARRELPLSRRVKTILTRRWEEAGKPSTGWIWIAPTATGHTEPSTLKKQHAKACREAKIAPQFVFYDIRHTSLTRLGYSGCDPWTFARIAGHGNIQMSMRYVHAEQMEVAGWWGEWWKYRRPDNKRKPPAAITKTKSITARSKSPH